LLHPTASTTTYVPDNVHVVFDDLTTIYVLADDLLNVHVVSDDLTT
jgi:hypothetical protein